MCKIAFSPVQAFGVYFVYLKKENYVGKQQILKTVYKCRAFNRWKK